MSSAGKRERDEAMTRDHDPIITNAVGMMGELAVARLLGVSVDTSVHAGGDGGVDMVYRKKTVCVKTVSSPSYRLAFMTDNGDDACDLNVMAWATPNLSFVNILGWCSREDVLSHGRVVDLGYGNRWVVEQEHLQPFSILLAEDFG